MAATAIAATPTSPTCSNGYINANLGRGVDVDASVLGFYDDETGYARFNVRKDEVVKRFIFVTIIDDSAVCTITNIDGECVARIPLFSLNEKAE